MTLPETMTAVRIRAHGGPDVLQIEEVPVPRPGPGEVLVRVRAVALNHLDLWVRRGVPGVAYPLPITPGCDFSGDVVALGEGVTDLEVGMPFVLQPGHSCGTCDMCLAGRQPLCRHYGIYGEHGDGGCAEYAVVDAASVFPKPESLSFTEAAAFPLVFITAWHMLVENARVRAGDWVVVHAAGSGIGSAAIQIAKHHGAQVIATAGSEAKLAQARDLGCDHTLNYTANADWWKEVRALTGKRGADIVVEHVGPATFEGSVKCLGKGGRVVICGATTGPEATLNLAKIFFHSCSVLGSTMGGFAAFPRIIELVGNGELRPVIDRVLPLADIRAAHEALEQRAQFGKIVLEV